MRNLQTLVLLALFFWLFVSCGSASDLLASESIRERKIFCNPFAEKRLSGGSVCGLLLKSFFLRQQYTDAVFLRCPRLF